MFCYNQFCSGLARPALAGWESLVSRQWRIQNLPGLDRVSVALIGQLRFMTEALQIKITLQKASQVIDGVFEVMNNMCVGSIDEIIRLLGTNAAEMALLDSTNLLDEANMGKFSTSKCQEFIYFK